MRRFHVFSISLLLFACLFIGCTRQGNNKADDNPNAKVEPPKVKVDDPKGKNNGGKQDNGNKGQPEPVPIVDDKQEKYEAAVTDAIIAVAARKWDDALAAFEVARTINDTEFVQSQIAEIKSRLEKDGSAKATVKNIETVLNDGNAEDALKLVHTALKEFGDGDDAAELIKLKLQAEALKNVDKKEDKEAKYQRYRKEGESAIEEKNLRAALLAFEQALQAREDAGLQTKYEDIRDKLETYDTLRKKAAQLRKDPAQLDEALIALEGAQAAWETLQIRNEIEEVQLALKKRRDTVSVVNFEVRNDVGLANAGATLADEILPALKARYDLVDRDQLNRVLIGLNAPQNFADDPKQQLQVSKLANVRYLVVGSINQLVGVTIRARLIDTQTGLVVQTARVNAATIQEAIDLAPEVARQLMMTDAEKMQADAQPPAIKPAEVAPDNANVPAAPLPPGANDPPPPALNINGPAPDIGNVKQDAFKVFVPAPQNFVAPQVAPLQAQQQNRLLFATVELGDFLFRAGRFGDAQRQFEFALNLAPGNVDLQVRLDRVRPLTPVTYIFAPRPRVAFMPFAVYGRPAVVPPHLSYWTPQNLAPYFAGRYEIADTAEIYWYMARMGLTMNDLVSDPNARRWLGRATGVRYFVFGSLVERASFDANVHFVDAELGFLQGAASINVRDPFELKLRLPELAQLTLMTPAERAQYLAAAEQQRFERLVAEGRTNLSLGRFQLAVNALRQASAMRPFNVQVQFWLLQAEEQLRFQNFVLAQRQRLAAQQAAQAAARQRQIELAQAAEMARRQAIADAAARNDAQRRVHIDIRVRAQSSLFVQAQVALNTKRFGISVSLFRSAVDFAPPPVVGIPAPPPPAPVIFQNFAQARLEAERAAQLRNAQLTAAREETLRKVREQQLAQAQIQLQAERKKSQAALDAVRYAQLARDDEAYKAAIAQGKKNMIQKELRAALAAFQSAQRFAHSPKQTTEVNAYIDIIVQQQAEALGKTKAERDAIERRLAAERERRKAAESLAQQNEKLYASALQRAQKALAAKDYAVARANFEDAGKVFRTDAVLTGLKRIDQENAQSALVAKKTAALANKAGTIKQLLSTGNAALEAQKYDAALKAFRDAKQLDPSDLDVLAGLTRAELARDRNLADTRRKAETADRAANLQRLIKSGRANLAAKQFEAAVASLAEAVKLDPTDAVLRADLVRAEKGRDASLSDAKAQAAAKTRLAEYQKHLTAGRLALNTKRFADAIKSFSQAQQLLPGDKASQEFLKDTQDAKTAADDALAQAAKNRALDAKLAADLTAAVTRARAALAANKLGDARIALAQARKLKAADPDVLRLTRDLDQAEERLATESIAQKKRQQQFDILLTTGKKALAGKRYPEAIKAFASAATLMPADKEAQDLLQQAQAGAKQTDAGLAKTKAAFQLAFGAGQKALQKKDYDTAIQSLQQALKLMPDDDDAARLLKQAQQQKNLASKTGAAFEAAMNAGQKAMNAKNYNLAVKSFTTATELDPTDVQARTLLAQARQALTEANAQVALKASFNKAMLNGQAALNSKRYADAVKAYREALKLMPTDKLAAQRLQQAEKLLETPMKKTTSPKKDLTAQYEDAMKRGADLEDAKKYTEAMKAFQEALKYRPKDFKALTGIRKNQFSHHMALGEQYADNMMWMAAVREAQAALRIMPNNAEALKLLKRAQSKKK